MLLLTLIACDPPGDPGRVFLARGEGSSASTRVLQGRRHHGLELDGSRAFQVTLPQDAQLYLAASSPEHELRIELDGERLASVQLGGPTEVDLSGFAGRSGSLKLSSQPPGAFLGEPVLATPEDDPERVVLLFVDTLRQDALGLYGSERPTSPRLDAWASQAQVFDRAWAPSPWTLPSGRAALSGRHPERWDADRHIGALFAERGFVTAALVNNTYLTEEFHLGDGWSSHTSPPGKAARATVDGALALLELHAEQDLLLLVHLMDPHLPYTEAQQRRIWADQPPVPLDGAPNHDNLTAAWEAADPAGRRELERFARLRYDQNVLAVDTQLGRLLDQLEDDDVVLLFSDHGEEFFEHGRMGHGFQLSEELTRVPFVLQGPGLEPGRRSDAATLQDIVPTTLELAGLPPEPGLDGVSLVVEQAFDRPIALGNTLFWESAIAVVVGDLKWRLDGVLEQVFDVARDRLEDEPQQLAMEPLRTAYGVADRELVRVWRVLGAGDRHAHRGAPVLVRFSEPVLAAWTRPGETFGFRQPRVQGHAVTMVQRTAREVFVESEGEPTLEGPGTIERTWRPRPLRVERQRELDEALTRELEALGYIE